MPLLLDGHWYASKIAVRLLDQMTVFDDPHLTPDGRVVLVCDVCTKAFWRNEGGVEARELRQVVLMIPQNIDGHDLVTMGNGDFKRIELDPAELPDLERLVEFDHLPESRKATSWMKQGSKLA